MVLIPVVLGNVNVQTLFLNDILCSSKLMASQLAKLNAGGLGQRKIDKLVLVSPLNILSAFQSGSPMKRFLWAACC